MIGGGGAGADQSNCAHGTRLVMSGPGLALQCGLEAAFRCWLKSSDVVRSNEGVFSFHNTIKPDPP